MSLLGFFFHLKQELASAGFLQREVPGDASHDIMKSTVIGFPRIGLHRELKFATESFFKGESGAEQLLEQARKLRIAHWQLQEQSGLDLIPVGDFSLYDNVLDTVLLLGLVPERYKALNLNDLGTYFAMARGYQGQAGDVKALSMKKWFDTNYHYIVPELEDGMQVTLHADNLLSQLEEASGAVKAALRVDLIGPFTFLKLAHCTGTKNAADFSAALADAYAQLLAKLQGKAAWISFDEPALVTDLTPADLSLLHSLYTAILPAKGNLKVLCQTYFGDIRDSYAEVALKLPFDGVGLDFVAGRRSFELIERDPLPKDKVLFAGLVNGRNIWRNRYENTLNALRRLSSLSSEVVLSSSCSLLHVPLSLSEESKFGAEIKKHFAFACEKLTELNELKTLAAAAAPGAEAAFRDNAALFTGERFTPNTQVAQKLAQVSAADFHRTPARVERQKLQKAEFKLPPLPTTTIGSFPQTALVRKERADFKHGRLNREQYEQALRSHITDCIRLQEDIGLDVLVHGEFERNDMVEYFGEKLDGYLFSQNGWVQSYGTRCVKPPLIWGDIARVRPLSVEWSVFAQSQTKKIVKGMLTGPVTMLNWSFPREDISLKDSTMQLALAIREEVLDLEAHGIRIIQIDEAALREKLPLRQEDWHSEYLDWAIPAFRFVSSGVKSTTQIHTHMCYSEFNNIIKDIDDMDADVITFEASRSDLTVVDALKAAHFETEVGPGVYDIHSPRIPSVEEIVAVLKRILAKLPVEKVWVNPDCGLKTRGNQETEPSLRHLVAAARQVREGL